MRIITCFIPATSGTVKVVRPGKHPNDLEVRKKIGYLPENNPLYSDMKVREYLRFAGEIRGQIRGARLSSRIDEMFQVCGLTKMATARPENFQKGSVSASGLPRQCSTTPTF